MPRVHRGYRSPRTLVGNKPVICFDSQCELVAMPNGLCYDHWLRFAAQFHADKNAEEIRKNMFDYAAKLDKELRDALADLATTNLGGPSDMFGSLTRDEISGALTEMRIHSLAETWEVINFDTT